MAHQKKRTPSEHKPFYKALGARMVKRREELGLTQAQVAEALRMAQQTYAAYEVGRHYFPTALLHSLADILSTDVNFLLGLPVKKASSRRGSGR